MNGMKEKLNYDDCCSVCFRWRDNINACKCKCHSTPPSKEMEDEEFLECAESRVR